VCESLNIARGYHGAAAIDRTIYAFGGIDGINPGSLASTETAVPEPASMVLLALGGLAVLRRRSR